MSFSNRAVFLDRDGTIIEDVGYLTDPADITLIPGAAEAIRRLGAAGFLCVVVTNQSAIGRGLLTEARLQRVHDALTTALAARGATLDGIYHCPAAPTPEGEAGHPDRKPAPGMILRATREHQIDLARSWTIGDRMRDLEAGRRAGCGGRILVRSGAGREEAGGLGDGDILCRDLLEAADQILAQADPRSDAGEQELD